MTKLLKLKIERINNRISEAEDRISELEDIMVEVTSEEQNKVKRMKRTEDSLRDLWDNIKCGIYTQQNITQPQKETHLSQS